MDSKDVIGTHMCIYTQSIILLSHKKEWDFAICSNVDELGGIILSKIRKKYGMVSLMCRISKLQQTSKYNKKADSQI